MRVLARRDEDARRGLGGAFVEEVVRSKPIAIGTVVHAELAESAVSTQEGTLREPMIRHRVESDLDANELGVPAVTGTVLCGDVSAITIIGGQIGENDSSLASRTRSVVVLPGDPSGTLRAVPAGTLALPRIDYQGRSEIRGERALADVAEQSLSISSPTRGDMQYARE